MKILWKYFYTQLLANRERLSLWLPVAFATGIGIYFSLPIEISKWWTLGAIELLILVAILGRHYRRFLSVLILPAVIISGFAYVQVRTIYLASEHSSVPEQKLYLRGQIMGIDFNSRGNQRLTLDKLHDFDDKPVLGTFRVSLRRQPGQLLHGQCVEFVGQMMGLPQSVIPEGYQFDRKQFYQGFSGSGYALSRVLPIECHEQISFANRLSAYIAGVRQKIVTHIKAVLPPAEASITAAIVAGEQGGISKKLINSYRDSGLAHFLSISGLHMSMLAGLMFFLVRLLMALIPPLVLRHDSKKIAAVFAILLSVVYLMISGTAIPAQRAFIMTFIVLLGILTDRRAISMKTIALAAFLVLLVAPEALIGASFQMSFAAVIALIAFYEKFSGRLSRFINGHAEQLTSLPVKIWRIMLVYFLGIMVTDLVASLATLPFAIFHFNRIAVYTSLANLSAGPIIGFIIMPFTLLSLLLMPLGLDYGALQIVGFGIKLVNDITAWVSSLPGATQLVLSMPTWGFLLIVYGGLWLMIWTSRWRWWGLLAIALGFLSIASVRRPDVLVNETAEVVAVKDNAGQMVILPLHRGDNFIKSVWNSKMAMPALNSKQKRLLKQIVKGEKNAEDWLNLHCDEQNCIYQKRVIISQTGAISIDGANYNPAPGLGAAIYLQHSPAKIITVRDTIGHRLWNE